MSAHRLQGMGAQEFRGRLWQAVGLVQEHRGWTGWTGSTGVDVSLSKTLNALVLSFPGVLPASEIETGRVSNPSNCANPLHSPRHHASPGPLPVLTASPPSLRLTGQLDRGMRGRRQSQVPQLVRGHLDPSVTQRHPQESEAVLSREEPAGR